MYCQQEKKPPRKVFLYQVQTDTPFNNGTAAKKATRTSSADFRAHRRCLLILPRHDQGRPNLCVVRLEIPNRSKNEKARSPLTCKQTKKKKGIKIDSRKSQAGVIWNFAVALSLAKSFNTGETFCGPAGTKITISLALTWVVDEDVCKELPSSCSCSWRDDREELSSSTSCRWLVAVAFRSPSDHDRFLAKSRTRSTHSSLWQPSFSLVLAALSDP